MRYTRHLNSVLYPYLGTGSVFLSNSWACAYLYVARAVSCFVQDLAELVNVKEGSSVGGPSPGVGHPVGEKAGTCHVAAARNLPLALGALQGLVRHLGLLEDPSNHGTFSLTIGGAGCRL